MIKEIMDILPRNINTIVKSFNFKTINHVILLMVLIMLHLMSVIIVGYTLHVVFVFFELTISAFIAYDCFVYQYIYPIRRTITECIDQWTDNLGSHTFTHIVQGWNCHRVGISLCVKTATECKSYMGVFAEAIKIGSFLNLERSIISSVASSILGRTGDAISGRNVINNTALDVDQVKKVLPSLAAVATLAGATVTDIDSTKFMDKFAKNLKNSQTIVTHVLNITNELGITRDSVYEKLEKFAEDIQKIEVDHRWFKDILISNGSSLLHIKNKKRVEGYVAQVDDLNRQLRVMEANKLNNSKISQDANIILKECREFISQYELIKNANGLRPLPVGVCLKGESQLGKTTLVNARLIPAIKRALIAHPKGKALFGDEIMQWSVWNYNARDDYDSNYCSQEIVYHDDAWQNKNHEDHKMYFTWISSSVISMNMSDNNQKGRPFKSLLIIQTCNQYPTKSTQIHDVTALQNRFPITVEIEKNDIPKSANYDPNYSHLNFKTASMAEFVQGVDKKGNRIGDVGETITIQGLVNKIVDQMIHNMEDYERQKSNIQMIENLDVPVIQNAADNENYQVPLLGGRRLGENSQDDEARVEEVARMINSNSNLRPIVVRNPTLAEIDNIVKNHHNDISRLYNKRGYHNINHLIRPDGSSWTKYLYKIENNTKIKFNFNMYRNTYSPADEDDSGSDVLYQIISSLGSWKVEAEDYDAFYKELAMQPSLRFTCRFGTPYLWGAPFGGYKYLIPDTISNRRLFAGQHPSDSWIVKAYLMDEIGHQRMFIQIGMTWITSGFWLVLWQLRSQSFVIFHNRTFFSDHPNFWPRFFHNTVSIMHAPLYPVHKAFDNFKKLSDKFSNKLIVTVLKLLQYFGLNVDSYWCEFIRRHRIVIEETVLITMIGTLGLLLYHLCRKFLAETEEIDECSRETDPKHIGTQLKGKIPALVNRCNESECKLDEEKAQEACDDDKVLYFTEECGTYPEIDVKNILDPMDSAQGDDLIKYVDGTRFGHGRIELIWPGSLELFVDKNSIKTRVENVRFEGVARRTLIIDFKFVGPYDQVSKVLYKEIWPLVQKLNLAEYKVKAECRHEIRDSIIYYHVYIELICLTTKIQGKLVRYTRNEIKQFKEIIDDITGVKENTNNTVKTILENTNAISIINSTINNHLTFIASVKNTNVDDTGATSICWGLGHLNRIYTVAHCFSLNQFIKYSKNKNQIAHSYNIGIVVLVDNLKDIAVIKCLTRSEFESIVDSRNITMQYDNLKSYTNTFPDLSTHLLCRDKYINHVQYSKMLIRVQSSDSNIIGIAKYQGECGFTVLNDGQEAVYDILPIKTDFSSIVARGDCGAPIVTDNRNKPYLVGFVKGTSKTHVYASMLVQEDVKFDEFDLVNTAIKDEFQDSIVRGSPVDLPHGSELVFLGKYIGNNKPVSDMSLTHWTYSPFSASFEEQMQPAPLSPEDSRIEVDLPVNADGRKSLLLTQNSIMCSKLPSVNINIIKDIVEQLSVEYKCILSNIRKTPDDMQEAIIEGINGNVNNTHCVGMELNKSAGIPWVDWDNKSKKSDYLQNDDGRISFKQDKYGQRLKRRVEEKLKYANLGINLISISSSKLKDSVIKISAVKKGKTRIFHCIPVDKIITDATLFSNFKEAYVSAGLDLSHAIGTNPHSYKWKEIRDKLKQHNNYFDIDYAEYDKRISREIQSAAFDIIRNVINNNVPDNWDIARKTQQLESLETVILDYDTCYRSKRGLKSGEYLTSVIGCIVNDIQFAYVFASMNDNKFDICEYRKNVTIVTYGDDVIASVSDEYKDKINYFTVKKVLESIGHKITPGNKDGIENEFVTFDQLIFLKRNFVDYNNCVLAPLSQRSIESPFVYTQIEPTELDIWYNLINQQLDEACLWGKEYYDNFREKLSADELEINSQLKTRIAPLLADKYENRFKRYIQNYVSQ